MSLLTEPIGLSHYLVVGAILFVCGVLCMATKRNILGVLMGIELVLVPVVTPGQREASEVEVRQRRAQG